MAIFGHSRYLSLYPVGRGEPIYVEAKDEITEPVADKIDLTEDNDGKSK